MTTKIESGTVLYLGELDITGVTDFGVSLDAVLGDEALPPAGVRIDVDVEGALRGGLLTGRLSGVDYMSVRADGKITMHVHGVVSTDDGAKLSLNVDGVLTPKADSVNLNLRENAALFTSDQRYLWVNDLLVWGSGLVDMANNKVFVKTWVA